METEAERDRRSVGKNLLASGIILGISTGVNSVVRSKAVSGAITLAIVLLVAAFLLRRDRPRNSDRTILGISSRNVLVLLAIAAAAVGGWFLGRGPLAADSGSKCRSMIGRVEITHEPGDPRLRLLAPKSDCYKRNVFTHVRIDGGRSSQGLFAWVIDHPTRASYYYAPCGSRSRINDRTSDVTFNNVVGSANGVPAQWDIVAAVVDGTDDQTLRKSCGTRVNQPWPDPSLTSLKVRDSVEILTPPPS